MSYVPLPGFKVVALSRAITLSAWVAAIALSLGFFTGWRVHAWRDASAELRAVKFANVRNGAATTYQREVGARYEQRRAAREEAFREHEPAREAFLASRPDLRDVDIGADGLCLWVAANRGLRPAEAGCRVAGADAALAPGTLVEPAAGSPGEPHGER